MKCSNCGNELERGMNFCNSCGMHVNKQGQVIYENESVYRTDYKTENSEYTPGLSVTARTEER